MPNDITIRSFTGDDQAFASAMQYEALFVPPGTEPLPRSVLDEPDIRRYHDGFGDQPGDAGMIAVGDGGDVLGAAFPPIRLDERFGFELVRIDGDHTAVMLRDAS